MFNRRRFDQLDRRLDKLELYFEIRDPGTARAAEAYDGLGKQLRAAHRGTQMHSAHLAQIHSAAMNADSLDPVIAKIEEFMQHLGLVLVDDPARVEVSPNQRSIGGLFEITGNDGDVFVVDRPAYVLGINDVRMVVRPGSAHFEGGPTDEAGETSATPATDEDVIDEQRTADEHGAQR